jgi:ABC-type sulfate transport system substrate-binding protein
MKNIKQRILKELEKKDFPDLKFLFSEEVLDVSLDVLRELLTEEKQKFEKLLKTPKDKITFETFEYEDKL